MNAMVSTAESFRLAYRPAAGGDRFAPSAGLLRCLVFGLFAVSLAALSGCDSSSPDVTAGADEPELPEIEAEIFVAEPMNWPTIVRCQGTLIADETAAVGARVAGRIAEVHVDLGDSVRAGQPLVTFQSDEFELFVAQAEAQLAQARSAVGVASESEPLPEPENSPPVRQERAVWDEAKTALKRASKLLAQDAISQGEFDVAAAAEHVAAARYAAAINAVKEKLATIGVRRVELAMAKQRLDDTVVRAPFDGLIQSRRVAPGTYINAGDWVVSLVRTDPIRFRGTVPERYASQLVPGLEITVKIESFSEPVTATVTRVSPSLDTASRSLAFEARIDNADRRFRSGLFAQADVVLDPDSKALVVPASAVSEFAGSEKVWKLFDGVAQQFEIATGMRRDGFVQILDGVSRGDTVLSDAAVGRIARVNGIETSSIAGSANTTEALATRKSDEEGADDEAESDSDREEASGDAKPSDKKRLDTLAGARLP